MNLKFESDFQKKILYISFPAETLLSELSQVESWRQQWSEALKTWHSPYKALLDCSSLTIKPNSPELEQALSRMMVFFNKFFLRKAVGWGLEEGRGLEQAPFEIVKTQDEALAILGIREQVTRAVTDFRSLIHFDNHFEQRNVELSFAAPVSLTKDKIPVLKSKLTNNLMLWHSGWSLLIDCTNLEIPEECWPDFDRLIKYLKGFFLEDYLGYVADKKGKTYPFQVFRSRHKAAAQLKSSVIESGRDANCADRKNKTP